MRLVGCFVIAWSSVALAQVAGPPPEIGGTAKVDLPTISTFQIAPAEPGFVSVRELRVAGKKHFDTDVQVKGYVIWAYDCVTAVAAPKEPRAKTQKRIDDDPTMCERPKLYLGESPKDPPTDGLWVVDVPRPPNKLERERLPKAEIKNWPKVPKYKVGDYVVVTGKFATASPHSERNSDGLVVFSSLAPAKKAAAQPLPAAAPARPTVPEPALKPALVVKPKDTGAQQRSIDAMHAGVTAKPADALALYTKAVTEWPGNHLAYYGIATVHGKTAAWAPARDALAKALELAPDQSMYHMFYGVTLYEIALADARAAQAKREGKKPDEVVVDPSTINFDKALAHLAHAVKLEPRLWRAHYYIGRIYRDRGEARWAAESFDSAVRAGAPEAGPWIALAELDRTWHYTDDAIKVAAQGAAVTNDADLWYVLGMAQDDKGKHADAIASYSKALDLRPDHAKAKFQRGQAYFQSRDYVKAKADLEAFAQTAGNDFAKQQATKMLMDISAKTTK